ncbi:MFS transporter [uncultured Thalassospira sp.]|jgi:MFS family permease|uniref:MFS transporter n=1 Tax=uncultured Thalassospira sp. TaxID=404382 RepID=UPI0030D89DF5|tara:strand:- start:4675 stop:5910 length:1236 start_codon:yes stop_codon:yes gene_type:complete
MKSKALCKGSNDTVIIVTAGSVVLALAFGVRAVFGGVIQPLSDDLFAGRIQIFSLSIAIQNLVWGLAQPGFGIIADKFGDRRALWLGFFLYVVGMVVCVTGTSPLAQHLGAGVLVGMGISGTAFGTVLAVVGRAAPLEKRGFYLGVTSAMGSVGQALLPLIVSWLIASFDWRITLLIVTSMLVPMAFCIPFLRADHKKITEDAPVYLQQTIRQAFGHSSFLMLSAGFFVCGFHLAFITAHLPNYVQNFCTGTQLSPEELRALGLRALALAGFANIFGTLLASRLGGIFPKPYVLAMIYVLRAIIILGFVSLPVTPTSVMIFGFLMGGLWLSTVPLTSALVLVMFGPRVMGTLFGFVFLSHQLGGFVGVWLGGIWFDRFDSYDAVWFLAIVLGLLSALLHLLVRERSALAAA